MPNRRLVLIVTLAAACTFSLGLADEGMWPLYDLDRLDFKSLKARGLQLGPKEIYNPDGPDISDAAVMLPGATGSFVSDRGLIITNHHVAFTAIQRQSTGEQNYLRDGFYAADLKQEIPAIGYRVNVSLSSEDVTDRVLAAIKGITEPAAQHEAQEKVIKEIVREAEAGRDVRCRAAKFFGGLQYRLFTDFLIKDVRIVYVPPAAVGNYGGDIDNWMWPRHTGDFAFLRAYVAPDGSSAEYSEDNIPYKPNVFLPLSSAGVEEGDLTMVIGYPGGTNRYASSYSIDYIYNFYFPREIKMLEEMRTIIHRLSETDPETGLRLTDNLSGIENALKNDQGVMAGFKRLDLVSKKRETEKALQAFVKSKPDLITKYGKVFPELDSLYCERFKMHEKEFALGWLQWGSDLLSMACSLHKWAIERGKDDLERERGYQDRDTARVIEAIRNFQINLVPKADRQFLELIVRQALELPAGQQIDPITRKFAGLNGEQREIALAGWLDSLCFMTQVADLDRRMAIFRMSREELENLNDPLLALAISLRPELDASEDRYNVFEAAKNRLDPLLIQIYAAWKPGQLYPDANNTKRLSLGSIQGYSPRDGVDHFYMTSLTGMMDKETGIDPFIIPEPLKQIYFKKDFGRYIDPVMKDVPVNFLTTNDGTGGNSGSSILNGRGEIVGLDFDGVYEGVASDYIVDPAKARSIICDIRYVLFVIDKVYNLENLMKELTIH